MKLCIVEDCDKSIYAEKHGLCEMHNRRRLRHGDIHTTRPVGWGTKVSHPLYNSWSSILRFARDDSGIDKSWRDFGVRRLAVDHCHKTGKVRGLLCTNCNTAIGRLKDDLSLFEAAVAYLKSHS